MIKPLRFRSFDSLGVRRSKTSRQWETAKLLSRPFRGVPRGWVTSMRPIGALRLWHTHHYGDVTHHRRTARGKCAKPARIEFGSLEPRTIDTAMSEVTLVTKVATGSAILGSGNVSLPRCAILERGPSRVDGHRQIGFARGKFRPRVGQ